MSYRILILTILGLFLSCGQSPEKLTDNKDYEQYLEAGISSNLDLLNESKLFWEGKLAENPAQFPYHIKVAAVYNQLFNLEAKISHLIQAENHLISANQATNFENASYLRA
ncbi:MAG: cell surface protein, partial [Flavobacteriaceae bacterium]|nr:cell surface protein [Flavobacteriaceae bacterium]